MVWCWRRWVGWGGFTRGWAGECCPLGPTRIQGEPGVLGECVLVFVMVLLPLDFGSVVGGGGWKGVGVAFGVVCVSVVVVVRGGVVCACLCEWVVHVGWIGIGPTARMGSWGCVRGVVLD